MATTALDKAISGEKVTDKAAKGALSDAVDKIKNLGGRITKAREVSENMADAMIHTGEMQGTVFVASFAEGYFGEEKMDVGPVDLRVGGGLVLGGYGLYKTMTGKGGSHALALGNGLLATGVGRVGRSAGKALSEKNNKDKPGTPPAAAAPPPANAGNPAAPPAIEANGDFGALVRDILLSPNGDEAGGRERAVARHKPSRFIRATAT